MNFKQLKEEGYQGGDASLEISLFEYGLIWKKDGPDYRFIYGVNRKEENFVSFDWSCIPQGTDPKKEWDWINWDDVFKYCGMNILTLPLPHLVSDLVSYYGYEEIFGSAYYPFKIEVEEEIEV